MSTNNAILISPCSLSEQLQTELNTALKLLLSDGHLFQIKEPNNRNAHLLVIDVDNEDGRKLFHESHGGQVKLLISSTTESGKNVVGLQKPVDIEKLKNVLSKLFEKMQAQLAKLNTSKTIEKDAADSIVDTLFHEVLMAKNNKQTLHISSGEFEVFVDGKNQSLKTQGTLDDIRQFIALPYRQIATNKIDENEFQSKTQQLQVITLHNVLWTAAITCSNGRLLPGHDETQAVKLRAWPSFTRNDFKPEHLKLAALLAQRPISLSTLREKTDIPYPEIVNFYNAAFAVDLIDKTVEQQKETTQSIHSNIDKKKSNLFNKIASRLGFGQRISGSYNG